MAEWKAAKAEREGGFLVNKSSVHFIEREESQRSESRRFGTCSGPAVLAPKRRILRWPLRTLT